MKQLTVNIGFITNSSSQIHWYPKEVLNHPDVKAFVEAYGIKEGYIGEDLWHRGGCSSFLTTPEQIAEAQRELTNENCSSPLLSKGEDKIVVIYGDEYSNLTQELAYILDKVCRDQKLKYEADEYN